MGQAQQERQVLAEKQALVENSWTENAGYCERLKVADEAAVAAW